MELLTREQILKADDSQERLVEVPEWGGAVKVRGMTGRERDRFEESCVEGKGKNARVNLKNLRAKLVALSCVDDEGNRIFTERDVEELSAKSASALNRIFRVAQELSGITDEDVDELTKNSEKTTLGDLFSD